MKMRNQVISIGLWSLSLFAFGDTEIVDGIEWPFFVVDNEAIVDSIIDDETGESIVRVSAAGDVTVPATLGGFPVTQIGWGAISDCPELVSIVIPDTVTYVGGYAFFGCSGLTSVMLPDTMTIVEDSLFSGCSSLPSITIPEGVTSIGDSAFSGCASLTEISVPGGVTNIGQSAFANCSLLAEVSVPGAVTNIGAGAFAGCTALERIVLSGADISDDWWTQTGLPVSCFVENRDGSGESVWSWTDGTYVVPDDGVDWRFAVSGGKATLLGVTNLQDRTDLSIPSSFETFPVTDIGPSAFSGLDVLTSVSIPEGVAVIDGSAFSGCSNLNSVSIPATVTRIGNDAFKDCSGLRDVVIPGQFSLSGVFPPLCPITTVAIANGSTKISASAFYNCSGLLSVTIPESVTNIGHSAFYGCSGLLSIAIPKGVTCIGHSAFYGCSGLAEVHISDLAAWCGISFNDIHANPCYKAGHLFMNDEEATDLVIPDGVTSIGNYAFYGCSDFTSVTIPADVTHVGSGAFAGCSRLAETRIQLSDPSWWASNSINSNLAGTRRLFVGDEEVTSITIPEGVESIGISAFSNCSRLTSITIPEGVTNIGSSAFSNCRQMKHVNFRGNAPENVESSAFSFGYGSQATIHVREGSTGWGVEIPGTWNGLPIDYGLVYPASVFVAGTGGAVVGVGDYAEGETAVLRASPAAGYVFACWTGDVTGGNVEIELPMTRA